jgi:methylaspartate mutase epsilon subunit
MKRTQSYRILLGGIGGDSHSVGLHILHRALAGKGYEVRFLGIQNDPLDFLDLAPGFDVVMISNMDGHAGHYLADFAQLLASQGGHRPLWYLGGNLTVGEAEESRPELDRLGFDRVYPKFVDLAQVLDDLAADLERQTPVAQRPAGIASRAGQRFAVEREKVLAGWSTGERARDLEENAAFLAAQPALATLLGEVARGRRPMAIQPRSGVPGVDEQIELFQRCRDAGAAVVSFQVDSLTRNNNYAGAALAIAASREQGRAVLNGFPVVNHGVDVLRRVVAAAGVPVQTRHSTRDPRLLAEISYAGGITAFEGGAICYNIPYYKDFPLRESIARWRYVDRLTGLYAERHGIELDREFFGTLTATLIPPCLAIVSDLLEAALAAEQGVRCVSLGYAEQGNRAQDVAAIRTIHGLGREILRELGHGDLQVHSVFHQYMAAFPPSRRLSEELIFASAASAALAGATRIITKTPAESRKIPTLADNLRGLELAHQGQQLAALADGAQALPAVAGMGALDLDEAAVAREEEWLRREVRAIVDSVLDCAQGDLETGIIRAFQLGFLDIPFAPSVHNRGQVLTARDTTGAVRFLDPGNLRLDSETLDFHRTVMAERRRAAGVDGPAGDFLLVEADVLQVARECYSGWPLDRAEPARAGTPRRPQGAADLEPTLAAGPCGRGAAAST